MIPLGDKEHLKEIIVNATVSSNAGSSWAVGGGALCFNEVVKRVPPLLAFGETSLSNTVWAQVI